MKKVHSSIVGIAASLLATSIHAEFVKPAVPLQSQKSIVGTLPRGATAAENSKTGTALPRASETETFTGGVFSRERGMAVAPVQTIRHRPTLPVLFDPSGKSNQIMVLLDFDDRAFMSADLLPELIASGSALPTDQAAIEDATLKALSTTGSAASRKFGQPIYSDYVLWQTRMTAAQR